MFCPNCGTKNDAKATKCGQCGFELKAKAGAAQSKFQGTVLMQGGPNARSATGPAKKPAGGPGGLKGTMVGVAPPGIDELRKQAAASMEQKKAASGQANSKLKGTMVGVAPPSLEDARKQVEDVRARRESDEQAGAGPSPKPAPSKLKGTMIGMAPPNMQEQLDAAKAELAEQTGKNSPQTTQAKPEGAPDKKPMPSKLKGTMMGVAPPDVQGEIAAAKKAYDAQLADQAGSDETKPDFAGTMPSLAERGSEHRPPPALDATTPAPHVSPFAGGEASESSAGPPTQVLNEQFQETQMSSHPPPGPGVGQAPVPPGAPAPIGLGAPPASSLGPQVPVQKSKAPLIILAALLVLALVGIFVMLSMSGGEGASDAESEDAEGVEPVVVE